MSNVDQFYFKFYKVYVKYNWIKDMEIGEQTMWKKAVQ